MMLSQNHRRHHEQFLNQVGFFDVDGNARFRTGAAPYLGPSKVELTDSPAGPALLFAYPSVEYAQRNGWQALKRQIRRPDPELLYRFVGLGEAEDREIADFATKWGPLMLCAAHAAPCTHGGLSITLPVSWPSDFACRPLEPIGVGLDVEPADGVEVIAETLAAWRYWAGSAKAIVGLAIKAKERQPVSTSDLEAVCGVPPLIGPQRFPEALQAAFAGETPDGIRHETLIAACTTQWLEMGGVRPQVAAAAAGSPDPTMTWLGGRTLFGTLAAQLLVAVTRSKNLALCSGCGDFFSAERVQSGRNSWCPECGVKARNREAARRRRAGKAKPNRRSRTETPQQDQEA